MKFKCFVGMIGWAAGISLHAVCAQSITNISELPAPELTISRCAQPPVIDGKLDDPCWQAAASVSDFFILGQAAQTTMRHKVRVTFDAEWLYVAFDVAHVKPEFIQPQADRRDGLVQRENCVKVAFDPGTGARCWYHIRLSAGNVVSDQRNTSDGVSGEWDLPLRSATRIGAQGWQAELALPFSQMIADGDLAQARLNLLVYTFEPVLDEQSVKVGEKIERCSWAPVDFAWWTEPLRYGRLHGLEGADFKAPFLPIFKSLRITPYYRKDGTYYYDVTANLQTHSSRAGAVRLTVADRPGQGAVVEVSRDLNLPGDTSDAVTIPVPVKALVKRTVRLSMSDPGTGEILQTAPIVDTAALDLFAAYLERSYYTDEAQAVAICKIGLPADGLPGVVLLARDAAGAVIAETRQVEAAARLAIPITAMPAGNHDLAIELRTPDGELMSSQSVTLQKKPSKPGGEVKIDRARRILLKDGKPFFPFGFCMSGIRPGETNVFRAVGGAGFNSILHWYPMQDAEKELPLYLDVAASNGLQVVLWPDRYAQGVTLTNAESYLQEPLLSEIIKFTEKHGPVKDLREYPQFASLSREQATKILNDATAQNLPRYLSILRLAQNYPNLLAYMIFDEPFFSGVDQWIAGRLLYNAYNEADGYHPLYSNYSSEIPEGDHALDWMDILCTDPYWIPGGARPRGDVNWVSWVTHNTRKRADSMREVTWIIPMAEYWSSVWRRLIRPAEQRCQTYLALIHGARGIFYYLLPCHQDTWDVLRQLAVEMQTLAPIALMPDVPQAVSYHPDPAQYDYNRGVFPDVQAALMFNPAGGYILLAANSRWYPVDAEFKLPLPAECGSVGRLFGGETYAVSNGVFRERLEPFVTRAYTIAGKIAAANIAHIDVTMIPHPELARAEAPTVSRFDGKNKNMIANPSFEIATLANFPDYYKPWSWPNPFPDNLINGASTRISLDAASPYHGKTALKISVADGNNAGVYIEQGQSHISDRYLGNPNTEFVFSAWLKGDRDGVKLRFGANHTGARDTEVAVTREWKRYAWPLKLPARIWLIVNHEAKTGGGGTVWIDALQLEKGMEPTEFADFDAKVE